jgi:hypothetical protein
VVVAADAGPPASGQQVVAARSTTSAVHTGRPTSPTGTGRGRLVMRSLSHDSRANGHRAKRAAPKPRSGPARSIRRGDTRC